MYKVYILISEKLNSFYIGCTSNLDVRMEFHMGKIDKKKFTAKADDWEIFFTIECNSKPQALAIEKHIKSMKSKKYILNLKKYPEMTEKLTNRFC